MLDLHLREGTPISNSFNRASLTRKFLPAGENISCMTGAFLQKLSNAHNFFSPAPQRPINDFLNARPIKADSPSLMPVKAVNKIGVK
jgi:hypothetical protein